MGVGDATDGAGRLPVCADGGAAVLPAGDAQDVAGAGVAGTTAEGGWHLGAGAGDGYGRGHCPGAVPARAITALGARDDPGAPGIAVTGSTPTGDGQRGAGEPGDHEAFVAG